MLPSTPITTLFLDIGGVLLTNGWDRDARQRAAEAFSLDYTEMNERHHLTFDIYEAGKLSLDEYLRRAIFYEDRPFTMDQFKNFMFDQSRPYSEMIDLVRQLKSQRGLQLVVVSNEGRELTTYRIARFDLNSFIDVFICSCFVHMRKPDHDIYRLALDVVQAEPEQVVYLEDRLMFVEVARSLGIRSIHHRDRQSTQAALEPLGLTVEPPVDHLTSSY